MIMQFGYSQSAKYDSLWNDPATEQMINNGIEENRKADYTIAIPPYNGATRLEIHQVKSDFFFGANAFMLNSFDTPEKNARFEKLFASLFNLAVVPFFWRTLEPVQGTLRFDVASEPIYRRPPPDAVLQFCRKYNITPKGHCLVWNNPGQSMPDWLPKDTAAIEELFNGRIKTIAGRYGDSIKMWDVVNEANNYFPQVIMPKDYVYKFFSLSDKIFPAADELLINETTENVWMNNKEEYSPFYMMIQNLKLRGADVKGIGLQFHFFNNTLWEKTIAGDMMTPKQMYDVLNLYARFGKPLQISEITIPTLPYNDYGKAQQARLTKNFYRLWFSHPSVEAIVWWNSVDGTAVQGEDKFNGGFVNNDFSPKPACNVLNELINKDWKTNIDTTIKSKSSYTFRGFCGDYIIKIKQGKNTKEQKISIHKNRPQR